jgi:hypothetical protein
LIWTPNDQPNPRQAVSEEDATRKVVWQEVVADIKREYLRNLPDQDEAEVAE